MCADVSVGWRLDIHVACNKSPAFARFLRKHAHVTAPLDSVVIPEPGARAVRRVIPASPPAPRRTNERLFAGFRFIASNQLAILINTLNPRHIVDIRPRVDELAGLSIDHPHITALVRVYQQLLSLAVACDVHQHRLISRIEIPRVVRNLLVIPLQLAGIRIDRNDAVGIEVFALANFVVEIGRWITDAPEDQVLGSIIGAAQPCRAAAVLPDISCGPGLVSGFPRPGDRIEAPCEPSCLRVERADVTTVGAIASGAADDDLIFDNERSAVDIAAAFLYVFDFDVPDFLAGARVQPHDVIIHRPEEDHSVADRKSSIELAVRRYEVARKLVVVSPQPVSGFGVQGKHAVLACDQVHDPIYDERRRVEPPFDLAGLKGPDVYKILYIVGFYLIERAIAPGIVGSEVGRPILRFFPSIDESFTCQFAVPVLRSRRSE